MSNLRRLNVNGLEIGKEGIEYIALDSKQLRYLNLAECKMSRDSIVFVQQSLKRCIIVVDGSVTWRLPQLEMNVDRWP